MTTQNGQPAVTGAQAWDARGNMWGLDPQQIPAAQANKTVVQIRIVYADGQENIMKKP